MNKRSFWTYQSCVLVLFSCITSVGSTKGIGDRFREYILDSSNTTTAEASQSQWSEPIRSHQCMECHDGSGGKRISLKHAESEMRFRGNHNVDHPVGMQYARYAHSDPAVYVPPEHLDKRIILENGEVTCLSCHETKTREQVEQDYLIEVSHTNAAGDQQVCNATDRLTTGTNRTTLCLSCHAL